MSYRWAASAEPTPGDHMKLFRPRHTSARGQSLVEFALVIPVMLLILLIGIDFGRLFYSYIEVTNASREAAAFAAADPAVVQASIAARAGQEANTQAQRGEGALTVGTPLCQSAATPPVTVDCATAASNNGGAGNQVTIAVTRPFTFITPLIGGMFGTLNLSSSATSPVYNAPVVPPTPAPTSAPDPCTLTADFTFDQSGKNSPVTFDATDSSPQTGTCKIVTFSWNFDDATPPSGTYPKVVAVPTVSNDYGNGAGNWGKTHFVTLKVTNGSGQTAIFQQVVLTLSN
jgi:Flp pilus assembly protein TadG